MRLYDRSDVHTHIEDRMMQEASLAVMRLMREIVA